MNRGRRPELTEEERAEGVARFARLVQRLGSTAEVIRQLRPHLAKQISDVALRKQATEGPSAHVAEALRKLEAAADAAPATRTATGPNVASPTRTLDGRWRIYADSNLSFSEVATLASKEGGVPDWILDAASDRLQRELQGKSPSLAQSTSAIQEVRQSAGKWAASRVSSQRKPGTPMSAQQSKGSTGSSTTR